MQAWIKVQAKKTTFCMHVKQLAYDAIVNHYSNFDSGFSTVSLAISGHNHPTKDTTNAYQSLRYINS